MLEERIGCMLQQNIGLAAEKNCLWSKIIYKALGWYYKQVCLSAPKKNLWGRTDI